MGNKFKVLVSVYNISGYLIAELEELYKSADIVVIETPCKGIGKGTLATAAKWIDRTKIETLADLERAVGDFIPNVFLCGGWMDGLCVEYAKKLHRQGTKTVLMIDTPWQGKLKQYANCILNRFKLTRTFDYGWGAGEPQAKYLRYLGFSKSRIRTGVYCADTKKFAPIGANKVEVEGGGGQRTWPHVFLYIGRYVAAKNMRRMERAFIRAVEKVEGVEKRPWTLRCIGGGELWDERTIHPQIEHLGYKRPDEIAQYVKEAGCFVLPSIYEPWGVVVHEAALMGLPMLCSNQIQAATAYLKNGENGYLFDPLNEDDIVAAFARLMRQSDAQLSQMGLASYRLGSSYTVSDWSKTVQQFDERGSGLCGLLIG